MILFLAHPSHPATAIASAVSGFSVSDFTVYGKTSHGKTSKGGSGSGFHGHAGRPGERGGSAASGLALFHGTSAAYLESIRQHGLVAKRGRGADDWATAHGWTVQTVQVAGQALSVYLTADRELAATYARYAAEMSEGEPVILRVTIPAQQTDLLLHDENERGGLRFEGTIPPAWIDDEPTKAHHVQHLYVVALVTDAATKGGSGSGFHGHQGRPGERGGSAPSAGGALRVSTDLSNAQLDRLRGRFPTLQAVKLRLSDEQKQTYRDMYRVWQHQASQDWQIVQDLQKQGAVPPLVVDGTPTNWYVLEGQHRLAALVNEGQDEVLAYFVDPDTIAPQPAPAPPLRRAAVYSSYEDHDYPKTIHLNEGRVTLTGDIAFLHKYHFTPDDLATLFDVLPALRSKITVEDKADGGLAIRGSWVDTATDQEVGICERVFYPDQETAKLELLAIDPAYIHTGLGTKIARSWFDTLARNGYKMARLTADLTIGRYAWAKEGANYLNPRGGEYATQQFAEWVKAKKIPGLSDLPTFHNAYEVATYRHPGNYTIAGADIDNLDVDPAAQLPLGKAFMLDDGPDGHGDWAGVIDLQQRKASSAKATATPQDLLTAMTGRRPTLTAGYIDTGHALTGVSDAAFWARYLTADEGFPLFDFVTPASKDVQLLYVKGGAGSGFHGHAGRPGQRGGSVPDATAAPPLHRPAAEDDARALAYARYRINAYRNVYEDHRTNEEIEAALLDTLHELVDGKSLEIRFDMDYLDSLLADGRFKTQFETNHSHGDLAPNTRKRAELRGLGVPEEIDPTLRPIYGFVNVHPFAFEQTSSYGDLSFVLKDSVRERATITVGDSLGVFGDGYANGVPLTDLRVSCADGNVSSLMNYERGESNPEVMLSQIQYIEFQVQNGVRLSEVRAVRDIDGNLTPEHKQKLTALGIEIWEADHAA